MARIAPALEALQPVPTRVEITGERLIRQLLRELGEDPARASLQQTPQRVWQSLSFLTAGYQGEARDVIGDALFAESYDQMVVVRDIEFYSLCEHHLLPFFGHAHIAYLPNGRIVGLSKLPRLVELFSRRLQVQERLTAQIAEALQEVAEPRGVAVVLEAAHLCLMMRGVQKQDTRTVTSAMLGAFRSDRVVREEFLAEITRS